MVAAHDELELVTEQLVRAALAYVDRRDPGPSRRIWGAILLTPHLDVSVSILEGRPVLASRLERRVLERAVRGGELPAPSSYVTVTPAMLDAVAEGGALR